MRLILRDNEAEQFHATGEVVVVREMKPQPDKKTIRAITAKGVWLGNDSEIKKPYSPSDRLWVAESWYKEWQSSSYGGSRSVTRYKIDGGEPQKNMRMRSPSTMPKWASRSTAICKSVSVDKRDGQWCWVAAFEKESTQ